MKKDAIILLSCMANKQEEPDDPRNDTKSHEEDARRFVSFRVISWIVSFLFFSCKLVLAVIMLFLVGSSNTQAQSDETPKFEVGAQFSSLSINGSFANRTEPGFGGRFTYNLTRHLALEAESDFFPKSDQSNIFRNGGRALEGLFGVKIGKHFEKFGVFGKARPGLISFSQGIFEIIPTGPTTNPFLTFAINSKRLTHFATDIGGVLEFYPSRRIVTRFEAGDTIIHYGQTTLNSFGVTTGGTFVPFSQTFPSDTAHNFQFSAGVGFRF